MGLLYTDSLAESSQNPVKIDSILSSSPVKKQELREVKEFLGATGGYEVERGERVPWGPVAPPACCTAGWSACSRGPSVPILPALSTEV